MSKTLVPWLAGAAAITLLAGGGGAAAQDVDEAVRQATADARVAAEHAREAAEAAREKAAEAREKAEVARRKAHAAAEHARKEAREHRHAYVFHDRSDNLRTILQLRPEQEGALKTYLDAVGQGRHDHMVRFDREAGKTTAQRLAEMEAKMAEQQAAMKRRIDATKTFYAQLDERQKKVFDSMPMLMFAGPGFGPMLIPVGHIPPIPPVPPVTPVTPRL